jgi:hypothetical protein
MKLKDIVHSRRRVAALTATGAAAVAVGLGSYAITASGSSGTASPTTVNGNVIPFHRGAPSPSTKVGQVPANWTPGSGTLVTGEAAKKAEAVAVAAYPGGTVDRVVAISGGEYNVHIIGVNWPHHVFVSSEFKVLGAE